MASLLNLGVVAPYSDRSNAHSKILEQFTLLSTRKLRRSDMGFRELMITIGAAVLLAGCERGTADSPAQPPVPEVAIQVVEPQRVAFTAELPGRTSAFLVSEVRPQVGGIVLKREFVEGSDVGAGQILYQIDPATYQAALDSARASLAKAQADVTALRARAERYR